MACTILAGPGKWGPVLRRLVELHLFSLTKAERSVIIVKYIVALTLRKEKSYLHWRMILARNQVGINWSWIHLALVLGESTRYPGAVKPLIRIARVKKKNKTENQIKKIVLCIFGGSCMLQCCHGRRVVNSVIQKDHSVLFPVPHSLCQKNKLITTLTLKSPFRDNLQSLQPTKMKGGDDEELMFHTAVDLLFQLIAENSTSLLSVHTWKFFFSSNTGPRNYLV